MAHVDVQTNSRQRQALINCIPLVLTAFSPSEQHLCADCALSIARLLHPTLAIAAGTAFL